MGPAACELCKRLQSVDISQTENSKILEGTFAHCSQLQQLRLAERVRRIGREAFLNCASLGEIHAPPALLYIARHAFAGCIQLCILSRVGEKTTWRGTYAEHNSKPAVHSRSQGGSVFSQSHPTAKRSGQTSCAIAQKRTLGKLDNPDLRLRAGVENAIHLPVSLPTGLRQSCCQDWVARQYPGLPPKRWPWMNT